MKISVLGAGAYGSALGEILKDNGHQINYYDPRLFPDITLETAINGAEVILFVVPSTATRAVLEQLPKSLPLIFTTKGFLELDFLATFPNLSVLSGGAFAAELNQKQPTTLTATSSLIPQLLQTNWLNFELTTDQAGVLLCGIFKNVYAIGAGFRAVADSSEAKSAFIKAALAELKTILSTNHCDPATAELSCGRGDFETTFNPASRNYQFGLALKNRQAPDNPADQTTEGFSALIGLANSNIIIPDSLPILQSVRQLL